MFQSYFKVPIMELIVQDIVIVVAYKDNLNSSENMMKLGYH